MIELLQAIFDEARRPRAVPVDMTRETAWGACVPLYGTSYLVMEQP
ncbi:hypothetical protein BRPE64_DCDS03500 (plasmid) [Caballeronia insecticola]|uniref:Uncharacterized protein n=1 Tax=Caballeronia insecticola TaxID=758793 RepID=R4X3B7_9BURK|nr:hypothetical protein BRPE64_DCDS03500 [Caballeronia insecticola]